MSNRYRLFMILTIYNESLTLFFGWYKLDSTAAKTHAQATTDQKT